MGCSVGKWKPGAKAFPVGVNLDNRRGAQVTIPRPILEGTGTPSRITFRLARGRVSVEAGDTTQSDAKRTEGTSREMGKGA